MRNFTKRFSILLLVLALLASLTVPAGAVIQADAPSDWAAGDANAAIELGSCNSGISKRPPASSFVH